MKRLFFVLSMFISMLLMTTCQKRPEMKIYNLEIEEETIEATTTTAEIIIKYSYPSKLEYVNTYISNYADLSQSTIVQAEIDECTFVININNLIENTKYFYRFEYSNGVNQIKTEIKYFITESYRLPIVVTGEIAEITSNSALCEGAVTFDGNCNISSYGFCFSNNHNPSLSDNVVVCNDSTEMFSNTITNLEFNTLYYVRAYATNEKGTSFGDEKSFTTLGQIPTVSTNQANSITSNSAISGGNILEDGGYEIIEKGVCWSMYVLPSITDSHTMDGTGANSFTSNITDLLPNTTYYIRAYATNSQGTGYGNETTFKTSTSLATITTNLVTDITETTAFCGGNIISDGGMNIIKRGVCWSTEHNPTTYNFHTSDGEGSGEFHSEISGLNANVTYYVRAYATSDYGTSYGEEREFTTQIGMAVVTTSSVTGITATSALCGGEVISDGGSTISVRGVCWSTNHNPTTTDPRTIDGTGTGEFLSSITGLLLNTTYYVRAYAKNSNGTVYGEERTFTTQDGLANVTTNDVTNITANSAICGGNISDDGGYSITSRGVCWSINHDPTTSDSHTSDGTGIGHFTSSLTNLTYNTTYYLRAYATNNKGTSYGQEKMFTTNKIPPVVTTNDVSYITYNSSICGGYVISDGGAIISTRGVCWSMTQNPTTNDYHTNDGNGTGQFISNLMDLMENTIYYVRAYAINSEGTSYGEQKMFITTHEPVLPIIYTDDVTNITQTTAICGGNVSFDGYGTINEKGVCWSTAHNPTINDFHTTDGSGTGEFISNINGLVHSTTYYVRAYATNDAGTAYGDEICFTTCSNGVLSGIFSVSDYNQVYFSQGNLQYNAYTNTWRFADNQYDYIGLDNSFISSSYNGWIDLFGWGTSGYDHGANCYQPWSISNNDSDYYAYGNWNAGLYYETGKADWGYNIINGSNTENLWRTLQSVEWYFLFYNRPTDYGIRYAKAKVNGINGIIILPDNWNPSTYYLNDTNTSWALFDSNVITLSEWTNILEYNGAVFLPAAGFRGSWVVDVGEKGYYWTSSGSDSYNAHYLNFYDSTEGFLILDKWWRHVGLSVRLVQDHNKRK